MKHSVLFIIILFVTACGSQVMLPVESDGGSSSTTSTTSATTTSEPDGGGAGGQGGEYAVEPLVMVEHLGPDAGYIDAGSVGYFYRIRLSTFDHAVRFDGFRLRFTGYADASGAPASLMDSSGLPYFTHFDLENVVVPDAFWIQIGFSFDGEFFDLLFQGNDVIPANSYRVLNFSAKLADAESVPGEFIGNSYLAMFQPFEVGDIADLDTGEALPLEAVQTNDPHSADPQTVTLP